MIVFNRSWSSLTCRFRSSDVIRPFALSLLSGLADWLIEQQVQEVVMESTAQYWRPVWHTLERYWKATCQSWEGAGPMAGSTVGLREPQCINITY